MLVAKEKILTRNPAQRPIGSEQATLAGGAAKRSQKSRTLAGPNNAPQTKKALTSMNALTIYND
ncbi:hypothetical protein CH361_13635 [Leptospira brenneri]|nr:hypothetical protein CH361_13635 [Leptospira brenneri]